MKIVHTVNKNITASRSLRVGKPHSLCTILGFHLLDQNFPTRWGGGALNIYEVYSATQLQLDATANFEYLWAQSVQLKDHDLERLFKSQCANHH